MFSQSAECLATVLFYFESAGQLETTMLSCLVNLFIFAKYECKCIKNSATLTLNSTEIDQRKKAVYARCPQRK